MRSTLELLLVIALAHVVVDTVALSVQPLWPDLPYESPSSIERPTRERSPLRVMLAVVAVAMLYTLRSIVRNWPQLTVAHHVVGLSLWFVLPLAAAVFFWRGWAAGRWILVALYSVRAIGPIVLFGPTCMHIVTKRPTMLFSEPLRTVLMDSILFGTCAAVLAFGRVFRRRRPT